MKDELDDWELALLVESRKFDDPTVVEAATETAYRDHRDLIEAAAEHDDPVVVEREDEQNVEAAADLLEAAAGHEEWRVVEESEYDALTEAVDAVEEALAEALTEHHDLKEGVVEAMSAPQMVDQFRDDDSDSLSLEALAQHPETGGEAGGGDGGDPGERTFDDVDAGDREAAREKLQKADRMEGRTPEFAAELRHEAASLLDIEPDDVDAVDVEVL